MTLFSCLGSVLQAVGDIGSSASNLLARNGTLELLEDCRQEVDEPGGELSGLMMLAKTAVPQKSDRTNNMPSSVMNQCQASVDNANYQHATPCHSLVWVGSRISCSQKAMMDSMARRPLFSSRVCRSFRAAGLVGFRPRGSKPRLPGS